MRAGGDYLLGAITAVGSTAVITFKTGIFASFSRTSVGLYTLTLTAPRRAVDILLTGASLDATFGSQPLSIVPDALPTVSSYTIRVNRIAALGDGNLWIVAQAMRP